MLSTDPRYKESYYRERRWIANALRLEWNRAAEAVGVKVRMYEGTKHSSASRWHSSGMPLELVRRMLRHRDVRSTERYPKLADSALVEAFGAHHARRSDRRQTRKRAQGVLKGRKGTRKAQRNQAPVARRTGLESPTSGRKCPETQGSGALKVVSRVYPRSGVVLKGLLTQADISLD
ncbi:MAG: site-specific integrase [bacterium]|nr:site-specific integrase [bacterium]